MLYPVSYTHLEEIDRLISASKNGKLWLAELEAREKEETGIKNLKIGYNKVFGYYIEVTKSNLSLWEFWLPYLSGNSFPKQRVGH